ncbi:MAG TPA: glycosyltransferase family 9 protein, partial [Abditibacteriaceae bacterium]|nr:glycosyltransferase family 9 protein [Abditibacteriaceae bacterium]
MKILILRFSRIGDCVLASPIVEALRDRYPEAHLTWAVQPKAESMVRGLPNLDETLLWDNKQSRLRTLSRALWRTRRAGFDVVLDLNGANKSGYFMLASGAKRRISGINASRLTRWSSTEQVQDGSKETTHRLDFYLRRAAQLDIAPDARQRFFPRVPFLAEHRRFADEFLQCAGCDQNQRLIGLNLGASSAAKRWPPERFAELSDILLREDSDARIIVFGAPSDAPLLQQFQAKLDSLRTTRSSTTLQGETSDNRVLVAVGRADLLQLAALSERCAAFVTGDTGPMHIAAAVGAPVIGIFGPTPVARAHPVQKPDGARVRVLDGQALTGLQEAPMESHSVESVL